MAQRRIRLTAKFRQEATQGQRRFRYGERIAHRIVSAQRLKRLNRHRRAQIYGTASNKRLRAGPYVDLQRLLSVHFYGHIHHVAAVHQTIGRCVRPATGQIYAHG